jgi:glycosyltransferase involved in cell wall biosynthesis
VNRRILLVNYEYPPVGAGAATATARIAATFSQKGYDVHVVTSSFERLTGTITESGVTVHRILSLRRCADHSSVLEMLAFTVSAFVALTLMCIRSKPQCALVFFSFPCGPLGTWLKALFNVPYIVLLRGGDVPGAEPSLHVLHKLLTPLRRLVYRKSLAVVANSDGLRTLALKADPGYAIEVIPNGVATNFYHPDTAQKKDGEFTFLFVGRFQHQKNVSVLIEAFGECHTKHQSARLVICGDGPLKSRLVEQAQNARVQNAITWHGWLPREDVRKLYQAANCFINPSIYEGMANTVLEAMASGLPVIAGNCIGNNDIIEEGVNGLLFQPQKGDELARLMTMLMEQPDRASEMGNAGRMLCCKKYSWNTVADRIITIIEAKHGTTI